VAGVSFTVDAGEVVGIAGPNGAGKTTLIALLLGFISPTAGRVRVDGRSPRTFAETEGVAYLPELIPLNPAWRAETAIARMATLGGVPARDVQARVDDVIARTGLTEHRKKTCRQLSKGNLQKVGLAQALLRDERVVVFDEPTHGLDPVWTQRFREIVRELRRGDRAILVASHNLDELERISDRVIIIDRGLVQRVVEINAATASETASYRIRAVAGVPALLDAFPGATQAGAGEVALSTIDLVALNAGLARAIANGALVAAVVPEATSLEREFHAAVRPRGGS
jgi:ABC-type multidrug transport system ATPase subunit